MIAVEIARPGGPEVLRIVERPTPQPGSDEVLIRVEAAGVNRPDAMQRLGKYPPPPGASDIPGLEIAGTVAALGAGVRTLTTGDRVCALVSGGGYAEYCVAPAVQCLRVPERLDAVSAAAIPETFFTVWTNLFERGGLRAGERALVHGGTSGIGTAAIQLARAFDAVVYATAGSDEKCDVCRRLGAAVAINYKKDDFFEVVKRETGGAGVNVILDIVGADYVARNIDCLGMNGRLVQIGTQAGSRASINLRPILQRRLTLTGSTLRARSVEEKGALAREVERYIWPLLESGRVAPVIDRTYPLAGAADAHRRLESSEHIGKIVLVP
jgi:NADPH2:quinone reductase